jgi:hypothetical protein
MKPRDTYFGNKGILETNTHQRWSWWMLILEVKAFIMKMFHFEDIH